MAAQPQSAAAMSSAQESGTATIQGTVLKPDGSPAIGADIQIALTDEEFPVGWQLVQVDPATATYEVNVAPGTWRLLYTLLPLEGSRGEYDAYTQSGEHVIISITENQTLNQDLTMIAYNATVRGSVLAPDGTAISDGYVLVGGNFYADQWVTEPQRRVEIVDGEFEAQVVAGGQYIIQVDDESDFFIENRLGQPDLYTITPTSDGVNELVLQMLALDAQLTGVVKLIVPGEPNIADEDRESSPLANALVRVYTENARNTFSESEISMSREGDYLAETDENGSFTINVPSGKTYIVTTDMFSEFDDGSHDTPEAHAIGFPILIEVAEPQVHELELFIAPVVGETEMGGSSDEVEETGPLAADNDLIALSQFNVSVFLPVLVRP